MVIPKNTIESFPNDELQKLIDGINKIKTQNFPNSKKKGFKDL